MKGSRRSSTSTLTPLWIEIRRVLVENVRRYLVLAYWSRSWEAVALSMKRPIGMMRRATRRSWVRNVVFARRDWRKLDFGDGRVGVGGGIGRVVSWLLDGCGRGGLGTSKLSWVCPNVSGSRRAMNTSTMLLVKAPR